MISLHGHLGAAGLGGQRGAARACGSGSSRRAGAALPGSLSRDVAELRERGLAVRPHHGRGLPTAASTRRSASSAGSTPRRGGSAGTRSWSGPGPGILGSATRLGHGGMAALDAAHAALALGLPTLVVPAPVELRRARAPPRAQPPHGVGARAAARPGTGAGPGGRARGLASARRGRGAGRRLGRGGARRPDRALHRHARPRCRVDRPRRLRGQRAARRGRWAARSAEDPLFFAAPLAAGRALAATTGGQAARWSESSRRPSTRAGSSSVHVDRFRYDDGEHGRARDRRPSRRGRDRRPRRPARLPGAPAARGGRRAGAARAARPASSTSRASPRSSARSASSRRRSGCARPSGPS